MDILKNTVEALARERRITVLEAIHVYQTSATGIPGNTELLERLSVLKREREYT